MRIAVALGLLAALTAAFTFSSAAPRLSVEKSKYELGTPGSLISVGFRLTPPITVGRDHVLSCHNQRLDRSKLARDGGCLEENANGATAKDGHATIDVSLPGRYEAYAQRLTLDDDGRELHQISNVVSFEVIDLCHFVVDQAPLPPTLTMLTGAPVACTGSGNRHVAFHSDDGTKVKITASGPVLWYYDTNMIRVPMLRFNGQGRKATVDFRAGPQLGRIATQVSVPAVTLYTTGPVDVSVAHQNGVATVHVRRGTVVGLRVNQVYGGSLVRQACSGRPTLRCLARIHYPVGGLKRREEYGKVVRAGRTARFKYRGWR